ncbi:MAG: hypothetical protein WCP85_12480 [Mariniphaga sp.]
MIELVVINYEGEFYRNDNHIHLRQNFINDCGIIPTEFVEQPNKNELIDYLKDYTPKSNTVVIHFKSHGFGSNGICQKHPTIENSGQKESFIAWTELVQALNVLSEKCDKLYVNLGTVCNSINIVNCGLSMNFDALVTSDEVTDPVLPRQYNKQLISGMNVMDLRSAYRVLHKNCIAPNY